MNSGKNEAASQFRLINSLGAGHRSTHSFAMNILAPEDELAFFLKDAGINNWQREYRFAPKRLWRFDFAWPELALALEIEGGV